MRITITIDNKLFRTLKLAATKRGKSISRIIEDAIKYQISEDLEDIGDAKKREGETTYSFDRLIQRFKLEIPNAQTSKQLAASKKLIDKGEFYAFTTNKEALEFLTTELNAPATDK